LPKYKSKGEIKMSIQISLENQQHEEIMRELKNKEERGWENLRHELKIEAIYEREKMERER